MNTTDFTSGFWDIYIAVILIVSFIGLIWLLVSQNKAKKSSGGQVETMGHEWDGIGEYNNPLPRWWFYLFVITVVFAMVYLVLYPGFASFKGVLGWTSTNQYENEMAEAEKQYQPIFAQFKDLTIEEIAQNKDAKKIGQNLFNTYCIQCHGSDAKGAKGFPNLADHDWLWGGAPEDIMETIKDGRIGMMLPFGGLPPFPEETARDVVNYILSLNVKGREFSADSAKRGKVIYDQICFTCHQEDGKGMVGLGPNLTDDVWLWGGREKDILNTITKGHTNEMPSWKHFLVSEKDGVEDDSRLRVLTAYVWGLSNADGAVAPKAEEEPVTDDVVPEDAAEAVTE